MICVGRATDDGARGGDKISVASRITITFLGVLDRISNNLNSDFRLRNAWEGAAQARRTVDEKEHISSRSNTYREPRWLGLGPMQSYGLLDGNRHADDMPTKHLGLANM